MRIIAGEWRGRPIIAPEGRGTRPTSDRAREGLFSMLASRLGSFEGLRVADLFAGTGALGLEALSRRAAQCLFIETDPGAVASIKRNIETFGAAQRADVRNQSVEYASPPPAPCDLLLLDPPYATGLAEMALGRVGNPAWVAPGGFVSIETAGERLTVPAGFAVAADRGLGKALMTLLGREG